MHMQDAGNIFAWLHCFTGCEDRAVRVWNTSEGREVAALAGHAGVPSALKWAPRRLLLASACNALVMWVPGQAS